MRFFSPLIVFPLAKLVLHLATYRGYGWFRDELYYIACSERLAFGYVDHPPLSIVVLAIQRAVLGDSLFAVRLVPALLGAATVLVVGLLTRELGGGRFAQSLAMLAVGIELLWYFHLFSMNSFDVLIWTAAGYLVVRIVQEPSPRLWLLLGALLGLGLQNKISVLWLGAGLAVGLLVTAQRRQLATRWPWLAAGVAGLIFLPHVAWQVRTGWPTLEFIRNATGEKMIEVAPLDFLAGQLEMWSPTAVPLWIAGLIFFFGVDKRFRMLGWIYVSVFAILMINGASRAGYLGPAYTWLFAGGAVAFERWFARRPLWWLRVPIVGLLLFGGVFTLPFKLPVLPVERYIAYAGALGVAPGTDERKELAELPQWYADMHGWQQLADTVGEVYKALPSEDRAKVAIFTTNYGNSGALDHLGKKHGLPPSISGHNTYWLWGPRGHTGEVMIVVGASRGDLESRFDSVERAATFDCDYCMPYEDNRPIWVARGMRPPLAEAWPGLKHYD